MKYLDRHKQVLLNCVIDAFKLFPHSQKCLSNFTELIETVNNLKELKEISITLLMDLDGFIRICSNKFEIYNFMTNFSYLLNQISPFEYYYDLLMEHVTKKCEDENYTWHKAACELRELISKNEQEKNICTLKEEVTICCTRKLRGWVYSSHDLLGKIECALSEINIGNSTYEFIAAKYQLLPLDKYITLPAPIPHPLPSLLPPSPIVPLYSTSCPSTIKYNDSQSNLENDLEQINLKKSVS